MRPKLSFKKIIEEARQSAVRFPFVLMSALLATLFWIGAIEETNKSLGRQYLLSAFFCSLLGISWLYSFTVFAERYVQQKAQQVIILLVGVLLLVVYHFSLPQNLDNWESIVRMMLLFVFTHLLAVFAPYLAHDERTGFWQYNQQLFTRLLFSAFYSAVLYAGIAIALAALKALFNMPIEPKLFAQIFGIIAFFFNTWLFLSGIPNHYQTLNQTTNYPKGLKIFAQYVLLPLVIIYLAILYAYGIKILVEFNLPKGWVVYLILAFSIAGILSLLLIEPIQESEGNQWIKLYARGFYFALLPLLVLHFVAIGRRIADYGITERRYLALVLGLWLLGICLYFLFSRIKNIKVIPISLALVALLSSFGFWGAFSVSYQSQLNRLHAIFEKLKVIGKEGYLTSLPANSPISLEDIENIRSIIRYFCDRNRENWLQPYFKQPIDSLLADKNNKEQENSTYTRKTSWERSEALMANLPFATQIKEKENESDGYISLGTRANRNAMNVSGYDYLLKFNLNYVNKADELEDRITIADQTYKCVLKHDGQLHLISQKATDKAQSIVQWDTQQWVSQLQQKYKTDNYELPQQDLEQTFENEHGRFYFLFTNVQIQRTGDAQLPYKINWLAVEVLIKRK